MDDSFYQTYSTFIKFCMSDRARWIWSFCKRERHRIKGIIRNAGPAVFMTDNTIVFVTVAFLHFQSPIVCAGTKYAWRTSMINGPVSRVNDAWFIERHFDGWGSFWMQRNEMFLELISLKIEKHKWVHCHWYYHSKRTKSITYRLLQWDLSKTRWIYMLKYLVLVLFCLIWINI